MAKNLDKHRNTLIDKFFEEFGIKPNSSSITVFKDYLKQLSKTPEGKLKVIEFQNFLEHWLKEKYQPDMFTTGGTISTTVSEHGSRLPDKRIQADLLDSSASNTRRKVIVYEHALDSSNQNLYTQEKLMNELGKVAFEDIKKLEELKPSFKKPGKYISINQIPYHFNFPKPCGPGTLITHGTDTLVENAALSSYMMLPKTLVWTGSWASLGEKDSDAESNIEKATLLANNSLTPIGVYIVIGNEIHLATRAKKINTRPWVSKDATPFSNPKPWRKNLSQMSYFASITDDPVGYFDNDNKIYFSAKFLKFWERLLIKRYDTYFPLEKIAGLQPAYVEHVYINEFTPKEVFIALLNRLLNHNSRCGAVIEGEINKNPYFYDFMEKIHKLDKSKGIFVLSTSHSKLSTAYQNLNNISPVQLRIKLSALLGRQDIESKNLILFIDENLAGEFLEKNFVDQNRLHIPKHFYQKGEFIIAFPGMSKEMLEDAITSLKNKLITDNEQPILLINGYGDGHIPIGNMDMKERLIKGFSNIDKGLVSRLISSITNHSTTDNKINEFSIPNILKHLVTIKDINHTEASILLRQVFMKSNELLNLIGKAIDDDIQVLMGTKVEYAIPNLDAYEIGTILKHIGVKPLLTTTKNYLESSFTASK